MSAGDRRRGRDGAASGPREHVGREAPGGIRHGPPLSITCACGRRQKLSYGESWTCESCGLSWHTSRIPLSEYNKIRRVQLRFRGLPVALGLLVVTIAAFFTVAGYPSGVVLLLPIALLSWFLMRPAHRKRYERAIAKRDKWTLRGEPWLA